MSRYHGDSRSVGASTQGAPPAVVLSVDGSMLGMQVRPQRRRRTGADPLPALPAVQEGQFQEVKTGVLRLPSERVETPPGRHSLVRRFLVSCLGDADAIAAPRVGLGGPPHGGRDRGGWSRVDLEPGHLVCAPLRNPRLLARPGACLGRGPTALRGGIAESRPLGPSDRRGPARRPGARGHCTSATPAAQDAGVAGKAAGLIAYYSEHRGRMHYDEYLRLGYGIGSGAVESAHKQVVQARFRQAGMRWSEAGARRRLALRWLLRNDQWALLDGLPM